MNPEATGHDVHVTATSTTSSSREDSEGMVLTVMIVVLPVYCKGLMVFLP